MKKIVKRLLKKNITIYRIASILRVFQISLFKIMFFLRSSSLFKIDGSKKKHPKVIQLPITYNCNAACVMCNIWKMDHSGEMTVGEFSRFLKDQIFSEVESVGINGGEPSLVPNLNEYADEILKLPKLKSLNIISHGFSPKPLFLQLEKIYSSCRKKNIPFHISISLDGVGSVHEKVRGRKKSFERTKSTIDEILNNPNKYCDSFDIGCTIVKQNIDNLVELDTFAKLNGYNIRYRLGIDNKRIQSDLIRENFTVIYSPLRQSAKEFFHYLMSISGDLNLQYKNYAILDWLCLEMPKRLLGCAWKDEGITLDSRGELYYCAVASKSIGSLRQKGGEDIFFDSKNISYRQSIVNNECDNCIHDYHGTPQLKDLIIFLKERYFERNSMMIYKLKTRLMF